ncbi:MAG: hypothetical protein ACFFD4_02275 [Candidatus Odinarchaeota archaeon]
MIKYFEKRYAEADERHAREQRWTWIYVLGMSTVWIVCMCMLFLLW